MTDILPWAGPSLITAALFALMIIGRWLFTVKSNTDDIKSSLTLQNGRIGKLEEWKSEQGERLAHLEGQMGMPLGSLRKRDEQSI